MPPLLTKFHSLAIGAFFIGLSTGGANAAVTSIDFNDGTASGADIGSFYSSLGVNFTNGEWSDLNTGYTPHPDSTGLRFVGDGGNYQPKSATPVSFTFTSTMFSVSVIANNVNANGARIELYDALTGGNLVGSDQVVGPSGSTNSNSVLNASGNGVLRVELFQPFDVESEGVLFDNLEFSPVPEPSSALLLVLSSCGMAFRRSRR